MTNDPNLSRATWRKSTRSSGTGECVEVAGLPRTIAVRDSKDPDGPKLSFTPRTWEAFNAGIKSGDYDLH
ncbi:protein of unknown function [Thermomonospora echinospora]|uniref:DUF397 domain-containing protein n=1 Tax=Thermomonospora echinospora TaxID=1992 RepID=A0A1H6DQW4_9ACTN|nr:DUF397 domain-containing protein [Thermomonospora echinospora]SEG87484.1 protein of unknown function [Thermomonospora echinospora]